MFRRLFLRTVGNNGRISVLHQRFSTQQASAPSSGSPGTNPFSKTTIDMAKPPPIGGFSRAKNFFYKNRQGILNVLGAYFLFSLAVHNYRVQIAWDKREEEVRTIEAELERVRNTLTSDVWTREVETAVSMERSQKKRTKVDGETIKEAILKVLQWMPPTAEERVLLASVQITSNPKEKSAISPIASFIAAGAAAGGIGGTDGSSSQANASTTKNDQNSKGSSGIRMI